MMSEEHDLGTEQYASALYRGIKGRLTLPTYTSGVHGKSVSAVQDNWSGESQTCLIGETMKAYEENELGED